MMDISGLAERRYVAHGELNAIQNAIRYRRRQIMETAPEMLDIDARLTILSVLESSLIGEIKALSELIRTANGQKDNRDRLEGMMRGNFNRYGGGDV